ncbi:hypothetical protein HYR54_10175 [Candidatus Acetothermia bacterium]|nr:hypothetical protein [Candidatus Acetothermia bacterium]MBI3461380.1 hypothetical protein [Candidatus Acetothermia bacterium]MBI3661085.1 hypothetical protein [Candidatus Acetothermia bacterium]
MFRKCLRLAFIVAILGGFPYATPAAPIAGSFTLDLVIQPLCANLITNNSVTCDKVDDTRVKVEADLLLTLSISGLDVTTATVFTFKGVESQTFVIAGTIGALTFRDTFVFSSDLVEIEYVRSSLTLATRYCINYSTPGDLTPPFLDCPAADDTLYFLLEDVGVFHPAVANLILGSTFDTFGMLDAPLELSKKIVDLSINIAGLTLNTRALFANFNAGQPTTQTRSWQTGIVLGLEGQTVSGITLRSETWLGARQGLECWGECKPIERNYGGKVLPSFGVEEEKIFIRNLVFAGVDNSVRIEFKFGQSNPSANGLSYLEWSQRYRLTPFGSGLMISNTIRLDGSLDPRFDFLTASFKYGDMSVTAIWYFYPGIVGHYEAQLAELITTFDPLGVTITSDLTLCTESLFFISCTLGVLEHNIIISAALGHLTLDLTLKMSGLLSGFSELWGDVSWTLGNVSFRTSLIVGAHTIEAVAFGIAVVF